MTISPPLARRLAAMFTAAVGLMNIISALYPALPARMELLRDILPVHLIRYSQTATVLVGFFLILLADGLRKRRRRAMQVVVVLLVISAFLNLTKGLDFEEAFVAVWVAVGILMSRDAFDLPGRLPAPRHLFNQTATFILLYYSYVLGGFLILRRAVRPAPSLTGVTVEPFRMLMGDPLYHALTPQAVWFERSFTCLGCVAVLYSVIQFLRPLIPIPHAAPDELERVYDILRRHGSDTLSYFALQDGRSYFFDAGGEAFLSYRLWGNVALVGGDPIGPPDRIPSLISSFLEFAETAGMEPCFLGSSGSYLELYNSVGLRSLKIGEEALIDLPSFSMPALKRKVRRAVRHTEDLGIRSVTYRRNELPAELLVQVEEISRLWVAQKGGNERGFSMTLGRVPRTSDVDCEIVVAVQGDVVWGYLWMVPVYGGDGWSLDAMRRRPESANGLMEFLVVRTAEAYRDRGFRTMSLNFATLSNEENDIDSRMVEGTRRFLFDNLSSFYQLKSLYQFNSKFAPQWRSRYMVYRDVLQFPKLALAIVQSEDPIQIPSPVSLLRR